MEDKVLMRRYLAGDAQAFEALYARHAPRVHGFLLRRAGNRQDADELLQAVFLKFHRARHQYDFEHPVLAWLYVIARNSLTDAWRRADVPREDPRAQAEDEAAEIPWGEIGQDQRQLLEWRYLEEMEYESIASKLNKSEASVRQGVSRALKKLRAAVARPGGEDG